MKIVIEAQHACTATPIGIGRYAVSLIRTLVKRRENQYALAFFDHEKKAGNLRLMKQHFGDLGIPFCECNEISYFDAFSREGFAPYDSYMKSNGDVYHFLHIIKIPETCNGQMVVTAHDAIPLIHPEWFEPRIVEYARYFIKRMKRLRLLVLADSECTKHDLVEYGELAEEDIIVIPLAYDTETCYQERNPELLQKMGVDAPYFLYFGTVDARKNLPVLLDAFEMLTERYTDLKLVIAGTNSYSGLCVRDEIQRFRNTERLIILGTASDYERRALFSQAIAFVFPSLYEGFGIPALESFACGCPLIASNKSALPEVTGNAALLADPYNVEEFSFHMERLLNDNILRSEMIQKGLDRAQEFSWDKTAAFTEQAYEIAMNRR